MIAYKGFNKDLSCTLGKGTFQYRIGETVLEDKSKCVREGLHCCEYVLDCMNYYGLDGKNRFCMVEAAGSIDEDGDDKISCTKMTITKELTTKQIASAAMAYMVQHPLRDWKKEKKNLCVREGKAECREKYGIAIARGADPMAKGEKGTVIGLLQEQAPGVFSGFCVAVVGENGILPGRWYRMSEEGMVETS